MLQNETWQLFLRIGALRGLTQLAANFSSKRTGEKTRQVRNKPNTLVKSTIYAYIYILHTYRLQGTQTRSGTETETEVETVWNVSGGKVCQVEEFWQSLCKGWTLALRGERKAINKLPEKIILICPRSAEKKRGKRERVFVLGQQRAAAAGLVGVLLMLCKVLWQNASARPRNPSRKLLQTWLPACRVPLRYPWQQDWVWLCVCFSCFLFHFCSPYFILTFLFVGTLKSRRCQANRQCPSVTFCGDRAEARAI